MSLLPFGPLAPYRARRFLPTGLDFGDELVISPLFDQLEARAPSCQSAEALERWLLDVDELGSALDQERALRYIAKTCNTENAEVSAAYLHFVECIDPLLKPRQFKLAQLYLSHPYRSSLPRPQFDVFDRAIQLKADSYRVENIPLETEEAMTVDQYTTVTGSLTVSFRGEEKTLVAMGRYLEDPQRTVREETWRCVASRRLAVADQMESLFDRLLKLRQQMAGNAGFRNYVGYGFQLRGRFDYTPADCRRFHKAIESTVMPVLRTLQRERKSRLGLPTLRPWDLSVDPLNRPPLRPYVDSSRLEAGSQEIFDRLDPVLASGFRSLREHRLLDLDNRKGKAPGGYQYTLSDARLPFIFMNSVGLQRDVETLLHEAGHAFHALACRDEDIALHREPPIEFCEVASMAMELLGARHLDVFYSPPEAIRAQRMHLEGIISVFPWIATIDAFQHWLYSHPGHTRLERRTVWLELMDRFGGDVDWTDLEEERACLWHKQLHLFHHPFYYVEYGIAQLGALQVWMNAEKDLPKALRDYQAGLALGGSRPLPELFQRAGCRFDFGLKTMRPLIRRVAEELERLPSD